MPELPDTVSDREVLDRLAAEADRDIYAETVAATGIDPSA